MRRTIGIIGMGVSGFAVLLALSRLEKARLKNLSIICFDDQLHFGRGIPFQEDIDLALINSPVDDISFDYRDMSDFVAWMTDNGYETYQDYVSRSLYGQYMSERGQDLIDQLGVELVLSRVDGLTYLQGTQQWQVTVDGQVYEVIFDELHLACGDLPPIDPYQLEGNSNYIGDPYPLKDLGQDLGAAKEVALIGTGLAAVDVLKWLLSQPETTVMAFSRSNYFPTVRILAGKPLHWEVMTDAKLDQLCQEAHFSFETFEALLLGELQALGFEDWAKVCETYLGPGIDGLDLAKKYPEELYQLQQLASRVADWLTDLWPLMTRSDRKKYQDTYEKEIINLRNPMPEISAEAILEASRSGRLGLLDQVTDVSETEHGFKIQAETGKVYHAAHLINATGYHLKSSNQDRATALLRDLLDQRLIQIDEQGGLSVLAETAQVISPRFGLLPTLFAYGELVNGVIYQNNSTIKIQKIAERAICSSQGSKIDC
ncbi:putative NAD(P)/FAD-binding protein YdhS [Streptococcus rupicaprae]|uniref:NAD(P)/FAD-binding protein YdhS n=1 Tax=Streptococcus rupicaprae TaxID=759619 RepID=A0ABV2FI71_9STRE